MTADERRIRFEAALEMVEKVYHDYCHDGSKTREDCGKFCDFVTDMINFSSVLKNEAAKTPLDNQIDEAATRQTQQRQQERPALRDDFSK